MLLLCNAAPKKPKDSENAADKYEADGEDGNEGVDKSIVKLTKAERRAKLKKSKKEAKKQGKELDKTEDVQQTPQAAALVCTLVQLFALFFFFLMILLKNLILILKSFFNWKMVLGTRNHDLHFYFFKFFEKKEYHSKILKHQTLHGFMRNTTWTDAFDLVTNSLISYYYKRFCNYLQ